MAVEAYLWKLHTLKVEAKNYRQKILMNLKVKISQEFRGKKTKHYANKLNLSVYKK